MTEEAQSSCCTLPTSFRKVFWVSSSQRISSFITITSPVALRVTCWWEKATFAWLEAHRTRTLKKSQSKINTKIRSWRLTFIACPKKPFPKISPWMRSCGRKMRWEQLLEDLKDSERPMSRVMKGISLGEFGPGDWHVLLLRLEEREYGELKMTKIMYSSHVYYRPV